MAEKAWQIVHEEELVQAKITQVKPGKELTAFKSFFLATISIAAINSCLILTEISQNIQTEKMF